MMTVTIVIGIITILNLAVAEFICDENETKKTVAYFGVSLLLVIIFIIWIMVSTTFGLL